MSENKRIVLFGATGMDGSNLIDYLLPLGYDFHIMVRRNSYPENQQTRLRETAGKLHAYYGDITDSASVNEIISQADPAYIINLAAMSHVKISFDIPEYVMQANFIGNLHVLEAYRMLAPEARYYFASSSECFGLSVDDDGYQRETTPFNPTAPYGISKVAAANLVRHYRRAYNLHACLGFLFNHSGKRRGSNFVCQKIVKTAVEIKLGKVGHLELGNMDSYRDIGNSKDYVKAIWKIVNHNIADDFVIATGETHSVRDMCKYVFGELGLNYEDYVVQNPKFLRPEELPYLRGDATKARKVLGWEPEYTFEDTMHEMIDYWMNFYTQKP